MDSPPKTNYSVDEMMAAAKKMRQSSSTSSDGKKRRRRTVQPTKQKGMSTPAMIFFTISAVAIMVAVWVWMKKDQASGGNGASSNALQTQGP